MNDKNETFKSSRKKTHELKSLVEQINGEYDVYYSELEKAIKSDDSHLTEKEIASQFFQAKTEKFRSDIKKNVEVLGISQEEAVQRVLPRAFATVKLASKFLWNKPLYDVQLMGGILLYQGYVSEMGTGEGKTLTAGLPAYLKSLTGDRVHIMTPNPYLAMRDQEEMHNLFELLGLSCSLVSENDEQIRKELLAEEEKKFNAAHQDATPQKQKILFNQYLLRNNATFAKKVKTEKIRQKQEAYQADIVYGAASVFAFDYLNDELTTTAEEKRQRTTKFDFAIIDEVDSVLFDDALTPFIISGKNENFGLNDEDQQEIKKSVQQANKAVATIAQENRKLTYKYDQKNDYIDLLYKHQIENQDQIEADCAFIYNTQTDEYYVTELGYSIIFSSYFQDSIQQILQDNKELILDSDFISASDYEIDKDGNINIDCRAFYQLLKSNKIPQLTTLYDEALKGEIFNESIYIDNAICAWFLLQKDVDYVISDKKSNSTNKGSSSNKTNKIISLVQNGRIAEGRVLSNGLHQAVIAKEKMVTGENLEMDNLTDTLASIPTSSFFKKYKDFSGMTGTSPAKLFEKLYDLHTHAVPRNKKRIVINHNDEFYTTEEAKNEAIFQEVLKSYLKKTSHKEKQVGQPILITTTSIEESQKLNAFLLRRFAECGYEDIAINVLNANVKDLKKESAIIAKAGMPGAITISTEMAARGTDIKLAPFDEVYKQVLDQKIKQTVDKILDDKGRDNFTTVQVGYLMADVRNLILTKRKDELIEIVNRVQQEMLKDLKKVGGLKVIGSGHQMTQRVDDQIRGRSGRQGNEGEVKFISCPTDLSHIGVPNDKIELLIKKANEHQGVLIDADKNSKKLIEPIISEAQDANESRTAEQILQNQKTESIISDIRSSFSRDKARLTTTNDYIDAALYGIEETIKSILVSSTINEHAMISRQTRLSPRKYDFDKITSLAKEFLDIDLSPDDFDDFKRSGELVDYLTKNASEKLDKLKDTMGEEKLSNMCAEKLFRLMDKAWLDFEVKVDGVKNQISLNQSFQYGNPDILYMAISPIYSHCVESQRACLVRDLLNPEYKEKITNPHDELVEMQVCPDGFRRVSSTIVTPEKETKEREQTKVHNLQLRPKLFTAIKTALNHRKNKYQISDSRDDVIDENEISGSEFASHKK